MMKSTAFKMSRLASIALALAVLLSILLTLACPQRACAAYTAIYGADGEDFVGFSGQSAISGLKNSGWNGLLMWALTVEPSGDITMNSDTVTLVHDGVYVGPSTWGANVASVKSPPTTVYRYECVVGGAGDSSFANIKSLIASQGTGSGSILYKNFQALKNAVPGIDAIDDDDESTYDINSSTSFGQMLGSLGYKFSLAPYENESFWVQLKSNLGNICDIVYLQCYSGGAGNNPGTWDSAFGNGFHVMPGIDSNEHSSTTFWQWAVNDHVTGGFYWPDVVWAPGANWGATEIINGIGIPDGWPTVCQIANLNSGLLINAATPANNDPVTGSQINQWTSVNDNQIWTLQCTVQNNNFWDSEWALTYYNDSAQTISTISQQEGGLYQLYPWYDGGSQQFTLTPVAGWPGCYVITFEDGLVMDDQWGGISPGTPIQEWVPDNTDAQIWQLRFNPQTGY